MTEPYIRDEKNYGIGNEEYYLEFLHCPKCHHLLYGYDDVDGYSFMCSHCDFRKTGQESKDLMTLFESDMI